MSHSHSYPVRISKPTKIKDFLLWFLSLSNSLEAKKPRTYRIKSSPDRSMGIIGRKINLSVRVVFDVLCFGNFGLVACIGKRIEIAPHFQASAIGTSSSMIRFSLSLFVLDCKCGCLVRILEDAVVI